MNATSAAPLEQRRCAFDQHYQSHLKHLVLKGLQPKTINAYARAVRRVGARFDHRIDALTAAQLTDYLADRLPQRAGVCSRIRGVRSSWICMD